MECRKIIGAVPAIPIFAAILLSCASSVLIGLVMGVIDRITIYKNFEYKFM